jgi:hypothetical protein
MKIARVGIAFAIAWAAQVGVSFAANDWLDHLSGPGPFQGWQFSYRFLCFTDPSNSMFANASATPDPGEVRTWLKPWNRTALPLPIGPTIPNAPGISTPDKKTAGDLLCKRDTQVRGYATFTYRHDWSYRNELVPGDSQVKIDAYEFEYTRRVGAFDFTEGIGVNQFYGPAFERFSRVSVTPAIGFSPGAIFRDGPKTHGVTVWVGGSAFLYGFDSDKFCSPKKQSCEGVPKWSTDTEFVLRLWVTVNPALWWW